MSDLMSWSAAALFGLGAFHGLNPGMGWLFAVALGIQERSARAVWRALLPLTLGHTLAIGAAIAAAMVTGALLPLEVVQPVVAVLLIALGASRILRHRHPRWARMKVGLAGLTAWSFLMATAHGAGLMVLPLVLPSAEAVAASAGTAASVAGETHCHAPAAGAHGAAPIGPSVATAVHSAGYLLVTALLGWLVYARLGLSVLCTAWVNLDLVWAGALVATGVLTLAL